MTVWICGGCGIEHPDTPDKPARDCVVCADERRFVPAGGQIWTTLDELADQPHRIEVDRLGAKVVALHRVPEFAIGQWSYLVTTGAGNLLWDPPNTVTDGMTDLLVRHGGVAAIAASHPHTFGSQVSWSHIFGAVPVFVNVLDRQWVQRRNPVIELWRDNTEVLPGMTLIRCGGHFPGSAVAHFGRTLLVGDTMAPVADRRWVTFLRSYPNRIPLSANTVRRLVEPLAPYEFDELYGLSGASIRADAKDAVRRSVERYAGWAGGEFDDLT